MSFTSNIGWLIKDTSQYGSSHLALKSPVFPASPHGQCFPLYPLQKAEGLEGLLHTLLSLMEGNLDTYMPGFTHLQKAQPVTLGHHLGAYFEMFKRELCPGFSSVA